MNCHRARVCLNRRARNFDLFAIYDETGCDYLRDSSNCIKTWLTEDGAIACLKTGKAWWGRAWVVKRLSGYETYIRCLPEISILTKLVNSANINAERLAK